MGWINNKSELRLPPNLTTRLGWQCYIWHPQVGSLSCTLSDPSNSEAVMTLQSLISSLHATSPPFARLIIWLRDPWTCERLKPGTFTQIPRPLSFNARMDYLIVLLPEPVISKTGIKCQPRYLRMLVAWHDNEHPRSTIYVTKWC